jgi:hypothetical protein
VRSLLGLLHTAVAVGAAARSLHRPQPAHLSGVGAARQMVSQRMESGAQTSRRPHSICTQVAGQHESRVSGSRCWHGHHLRTSRISASTACTFWPSPRRKATVSLLRCILPRNCSTRPSGAGTAGASAGSAGAAAAAPCANSRVHGPSHVRWYKTAQSAIKTALDTARDAPPPPPGGASRCAFCVGRGPTLAQTCLMGPASYQHGGFRCAEYIAAIVPAKLPLGLHSLLGHTSANGSDLA